ncbi:hypothetical protein B0I72DRAFT_163683 [Yarrowia lipolytica]|uniref:NTF2 domain-containing protein n=1 Tax=Yarrowia lipolytica TaxID=4952 RepID=A0A371C555_YARLL|nr:hypothetical protein B0I71DRAFT_171091 [Yarrowia lipolytica]RDW33972.1 hypothetical protein B0I72DRAFT_163683 [Yarrowia lipolytica]RDW36911.1 hypothetical protein B0I73DRAFT_163383 [Yarrowia lipolytica]RDW44633.1 hypothetical protein B0I74DRAFT_164590 [Yarrowia lipolytica]RDW51574.1 hypothetical protein B0I75DRAFT_169946 [Yarrowia lipolytica]
MSPTAEQIAWLFVSQYFKRLHSDPSELHHFYDVDAKLLHGKEQDDTAAISGTESIQERISQLHTKGCKTLISCLDAMEGPNKSILIQIIGQMSSTDDGVPQKFVQSVVLESKSGTNYSIYSDVFRFLKDDDEEVAKEDVKEEPKEDVKEEPKKEVEAKKEPKKEEPKKEEPKKEEPKKEEALKKEEPKKDEPKKEAPSAAPVAAPATPVAASSPSAASAAPETKEEPKKETAAAAPPAAATSAPAEPTKPSGPISWAARARSSDKPAPAGSATPAETPSPVAAAAVAKKEPSSSPTVAAATTSSASSAAGNRKGTFHSAYIKGVDGNTDLAVVEAALKKIGNGISHFEVTKSRNSVFVDFNDAQTLRKALELRELKVGDLTIIIDERKRRKPGSGSGTSNGGGSGSGSSGNRDSNKRQGTKRR